MTQNTSESEKKKIFLIDDDQFLPGIFSTKFVNNGFLVETAENASVALEKIKNGLTADVFLVDIEMVGMNGIELVRTLKSQNLIAPTVKIIMLTSSSDDTNIKAVKELGVDGYIIKSAAFPSEVLAIVQKVIAGEKVFADSF